MASRYLLSTYFRGNKSQIRWGQLDLTKRRTRICFQRVSCHANAFLASFCRVFEKAISRSVPHGKFKTLIYNCYSFSPKLFCLCFKISTSEAPCIGYYPWIEFTIHGLYMRCINMISPRILVITNDSELSRGRENRALLDSLEPFMTRIFKGWNLVCLGIYEAVSFLIKAFMCGDDFMLSTVALFCSMYSALLICIDRPIFQASPSRRS